MGQNRSRYKLSGTGLSSDALHRRELSLRWITNLGLGDHLCYALEIRTAGKSLGTGTLAVRPQR